MTNKLYFPLLKASGKKKIQASKIGAYNFINHGLCKCVCSILNRGEFDLSLALLEL